MLKIAQIIPNEFITLIPVTYAIINIGTIYSSISIKTAKTLRLYVDRSINYAE
jgi:hypothetical protein